MGFGRQDRFDPYPSKLQEAELSFANETDNAGIVALRSGGAKTCSGDDGGPIVKVRKSSDKVKCIFGVSSTYVGDCTTTLPNYSYVIRASFYSDFVKKALKTKE
ncbi:uncharacterized protein LOC134847593 [Symsagittifera roscoffensis]|uniref:uncharacterized protein LOC134847593 n=1 Tax=Symsagittifera roscoffensis TaxID=84072 RepID=UPI00307B90A5